MRLDGGKVHHPVVEGREVRVGVHDGGRDAVKAAALELAKHGKDGAVRNGRGRPTEVSGSC